VDPSDKGGVPKGFTGHDGTDVTRENMEWFAKSKPGHNIALRLPDGMMGIDVDAHSGKTGAETAGEAVKRWGALTLTYRSTSRDDGISGISLYRIPEGVELCSLIEFKDLGIGDIEIVQRHHRNVHCWPSIHPQTRQVYRWIDERDGSVMDRPPAPTDIPELPPRWLDALRKRRSDADIGSDALIDVASTLTEGQPSARVTAKLREALSAIGGPSRHDSVRNAVLALMRCGQDGEPGVLAALRTLQAAFVAGVTADGSRTPAQAVAEFGRFITNKRAAQLLAEPSNTDWFDDMTRQPAPGHTEAQVPAVPVDQFDAAVTAAMERLRIRREANRRLDAEERPQIELPPVKSLATLLAEPDSPTRYRIDGLMPEGGRVVLSARKKAGKTTTTINLIRSLVDDDDPFLGAFPVTAPVRGLVAIDNELDENMARRWLRDQGIRNTASVVDHVALRGKVAAFDLTDDKRRGQCARRLSDVGCDFVFLDCLRPVLDAFGLDENHDAGKFLTAFDALLVEAGVTNAVVVHHMGNSGERSRGDSRIEDWPDAVWRLVPEDANNPQSPRYFSAFGRDVDVREGRLTFDPATRRLTYAGGSRSDARTEAAYGAVIDYLAENAGGSGVSQTAVEKAFSGEHARESVRGALKQAVGRGAVVVVEGPKRARLHSIAHPCASCGRPVASQAERHESCSSASGEGGR
jgi:hypothetical protein